MKETPIIESVPTVVEHMVLVDPRGFYCGDQFIADRLVQRRGRVALIPLGNVYLVRSAFDIYKRSAHDRVIVL